MLGPGVLPIESGVAQAKLHESVSEAMERAESLNRAVLASVSMEAAPEIDVSACVFENRTAEERYFVWEQPERDRFALGCLGSAWVVDSDRSGDRFGSAAAHAAEVLRDAVIADERNPLGGPLWVGGFAFSPGGGAGREWSSLPATLLMLPQLSMVRKGSDVAVTLNVVCRAGDDADALAAAAARAESLRPGSIPITDPDPVGGYEISSPLAPEQYVKAVAEARERVRAGELEKVVLAREVRVEAGTRFHPAAVFGGLRAAFPSCYCYCVGTPDAAFVGASPELLVRREGGQVSTVAMAGSTRRSADPAVDDHLGQRLLQSGKDRDEHTIVARRIERALEPVSVWVAAADEPGLVKVANIQHLATPVRAQLADARSAVELAGLLHPTPAVGGEPWERARKLIDDLEPLDRGWYAGPVGWMDAAEDGEFCVALRCALLEGRVAHCYAGVGVVSDSDPEAELAETEVKLEALLPLLTGA